MSNRGIIVLDESPKTSLQFISFNKNNSNRGITVKFCNLKEKPEVFYFFYLEIDSG